jgi:hypothetical protein
LQDNERNGAFQPFIFFVTSLIDTISFLCYFSHHTRMEEMALSNMGSDLRKVVMKVLLVYQEE